MARTTRAGIDPILSEDCSPLLLETGGRGQASPQKDTRPAGMVPAGRCERLSCLAVADYLLAGAAAPGVLAAGVAPPGPDACAFTALGGGGMLGFLSGYCL